MVSQKLAKEKPEAVKGLVRAINKAMHGGDRQSRRGDRAACQEGAAINKAIEKQRLIYVTPRSSRRPRRPSGVGDTKDARMTEMIGTIAASSELPRKPAAADVFSRAFLPPKTERMLGKPTN